MALPTHSAWTSPQTATGDAIPTPGQSSPAPLGTPPSLATLSLLGPAGPPSSARSASSFLPSRRAPVAPRAVPTWLGSGQPADRTTVRVLLQMWLADIVKELKRCVCGVMMSLWRKTLGLALQCRPLILTSSSRISCCSARLAELTHTNTSLTSRSSERRPAVCSALNSDWTEAKSGLV